MIKLKINDKTYGFEIEEIEDDLVEGAISKIEEAEENMGMMGGIIKSSLSSFLPMLGINKPAELKDMDSLQFAAYYAITEALKSLEGKTIEINAIEVNENEEETTTEN